MVVQFSLDVPPVSASTDDRHPVKKKYLVARNRERKSSIFDYVNLSSTLLRKVRYGQSLDAALQARSPWTSDTHSPGKFRSSCDSPGTQPPVSIWRNLETPHADLESPTTRRRARVSLNQRNDKVTHHLSSIKYGRQIQLQATDGGFLALDVDGYMIKLPQSHRDDPRTHLTLFPQNPLLAPGSKSRVCTGEPCFIVVGAATVISNHKVLYADAKQVLEAPAQLRNAVMRHQRQHRGGRTNSQSDLSLGPRGVRVDQQSTVWSFRTTTARPGERDVLENGMLVQLKQRDFTMHYETERIAKKKYKPVTSIGPETEDISPPDEKPVQDPPPSDANDADDSPGESHAPAFTHVWLQQNDISSQRDTRVAKLDALKPTQWDNLWFVVDVAVEHERDQRQKHSAAVLEAERESELRTRIDIDDRDEERVGVRPKRTTASIDSVIRSHEPIENNNHEQFESIDNSINNKRLSVLNARVFVSQAAEEAQRHAAAIIVRFLRRVLRREAERRAKDLIDRRIRRTGKFHRRGEVDECTLSTTQQLHILQCFKPNVYGSQRAIEPFEFRRIPGISLQGSKYPRQEAQRLASIQRDLTYLASPDFQQQQVIVRHPNRQVPRLQPESPFVSSSVRSKYHLLTKDRERDHKMHVHLAKTHREKPPFRFGKVDLRVRLHQRPQTAPASPLPKPS